MQVDPIKPTLKAPGTKRLKQKCDAQLSTAAFKFNLRLYNEAMKLKSNAERAEKAATAAAEAGAYTRSLLSST